MPTTIRKIFRPQLLLVLLLLTGTSSCQKNSENQKQVLVVEASEEAAEQRPSPPVQNTIDLESNTLTVNYSSPGVKGREVWDVLVPYGQVWRTGANEATWFSTSKDILINNVKLDAGKYGFFTIPGEEKWTVILNKTWDQWGAYEYKSKHDVVRFDVPVYVLDENQERLAIKFEASDESQTVTLVFGWSDLGFKIPISNR